MKTYSFDKLPDANGPKVDEYITSDYPSTLSKFLKDAFWDNLFVFRSANIFYVILLCAGIFLAIFAADYQRLCLAILVKTIYFGGGTPSLLSVKNIEEILDLLNKNYEIISSPEITLEINPDTIDREKMESLKQIGINRMSVGIQSFNDEDLKYLGRRHDSRHAMQVLEDLKHTDFEKITLDLIYGMPTLTEEKWKYVKRIKLI